MQGLVASRLGQVNLTSLAQPLTTGLEYGLLRALNISMNQFFTAVTATSNMFSVTIRVSNKVSVGEAPNRNLDKSSHDLAGVRAGLH